MQGGSGAGWLAMLGGLALSGSVWAQDIPALESQTDDTIRSACHGYLVDMLPRDWQDDAYAATGRCDPGASRESDATPPAVAGSAGSAGTSVELGQRRERNLDITIECQSEYMCMEQRVRLREADTPIAQPEYDRVAAYCEQHYACIQSFLRDWPKPLPSPAGSQAGQGFTFDSLSAEAGGASRHGPEELTARLDSGASPGAAAAGDAGMGFDGLESHRRQEKNLRLSHAAWQTLHAQTARKSLSHALKDRCGDIGLAYRTPASPRSIQQDMRAMKDRFSDFTRCYENVAGGWDAQAYAEALAGYEQQLKAIEQRYAVDLSGKRRPPAIEQEVSAMQQNLEDKAQRLRKQLKTGPEWIESLYASGSYKRPNSGPSAMAILSQSLTQLNNSLAQQNARRQRELDAMLRSVTVPRVEPPRIATPRVGTAQVAAPRIQVPRVAVPRNAPASPDALAQNTAGDEVASFGCYAPGLQVCINYTMPGRELESYRQRCRSQGNQVLGQCRGGAPACEHRNFAGSVVTYNYDRSESDTTRRQCQAGGGLYRAS